MPLDTHQAYKRLQENDVFTPEQAERITETLAELDAVGVTKGDLEDVRSSLKEDIEDVRSSLKEDIEDVRSSLKEDIEDLEEGMNDLEKRLTRTLTTRMDARIARLERRLLVAGIPAVAAIVTLVNYLMG